MLSQQQNELITRVGPGTPMGKVFRRYWIPAALSEEVARPGGSPARVRLLGEKLVVYRDPAGTLGLVGEYCPHRGASLALARNEVGGLRCLYHGWKINEAGRVLETPAEPPVSNLARKLCHRNYPVREAGGIIWTYMGPQESEPPFPKFPWLDLKSPNLLVVKMRQDCNYLQGVEGDIDPAHANYLHQDLDVAQRESWAGAGWNSILALMYDGAPRIECEDTAYGMRIGTIRRTTDDSVSYVRMTECIAPFYCYVATANHESQLFKAWLPIDDENCFTFYIHFDPDRALDPDAIFQNWGHKTSGPDYRVPYHQDRERMAHNFSGVEGAAIQDLAVQESMGPIYDRREEHLGTSDRAIIYYRRMLARLTKDVEAGTPLPALDPALDFKRRSVACFMPSDRPWQEALDWLERDVGPAMCRLAQAEIASRT
jgi:phenylpropionate dioxygenase-like ring-hydroxylating dioxygenase large terminal subunit